ncbi:hypothetical protein SAMN05877831_101267 [Rhodobacter maris]|uniref:PAS domain-containing protein n=1 Tax=Rhodobacter maris TaxID=446682 RepID=A0A285RIC7_9RHOB|nr:hypothetical protein SAMN05877831_101267 [Rhodobacter maris]
MRLARLSLRLRVFLFFAALALGNIVALVAGLVFGFEKLGEPEALDGFIIGGVVAGFVITGLITAVWFLFDENVAKPIERLAGGIRARTHSQIETDLDAEAGRYLGDLAPAAAAITRHLNETRSALTESVQRETTRLAQEKDRLETLLSDVPVGVLLCTAAHQLVFYNGQATDLLGGTHAPGLDRRVFDYLHPAPILHAYARLLETDDPDAASDLLCATTADGKTLAARMRLISEGEDHHVTRRAGYVLTLRDVSADMRAHARREALMDELFDRIRRPAAALQSLTGVLIADDGPSEPAARARLRGAAREEAANLGAAIHTLFERHEAMRSDWGALSMVRASDLGEAVRARLAASGEEITPVTAPLILRIEGFEMVSLLAMLGRELGPERHEKRLEIIEEGAGALIALEWRGERVPISVLERWLDQPLEVGMEDVTGRRVIAAMPPRSGPRIWGRAAGGSAFRCARHAALRNGRRRYRARWSMISTCWAGRARARWPRPRSTGSPSLSSTPRRRGFCPPKAMKSCRSPRCASSMAGVWRVRCSTPWSIRDGRSPRSRLRCTGSRKRWWPRRPVSSRSGDGFTNSRKGRCSSPITRPSIWNSCAARRG